MLSGMHVKLANKVRDFVPPGHPENNVCHIGLS